MTRQRRQMQRVFRNLDNGECQEIHALCVFIYEDCPGSYLDGWYLDDVLTAWDAETNEEVDLTKEELESIELQEI